MKVALILSMSLVASAVDAVQMRNLTPEEWRREQRERSCQRANKPQIQVPPLPTKEEIEAMCQGDENSISLNIVNALNQGFRYRKYYKEEDCARVGYQFLTNAVVKPYQKGCRGATRHLKDCLRFPCLIDDANVLDLCVGMLGEYCLLPATTNDVGRWVALPRSSWPKTGGQIPRKWVSTPTYDHNLNVKYKHSYLYGIVKELAKAQEKKLPESKRPAFRTSVIERARLLPEEAEKLFGD